MAKKSGTTSKKNTTPNRKVPSKPSAMPLCPVGEYWDSNAKRCRPIPKPRDVVSIQKPEFEGRYGEVVKVDNSRVVVDFRVGGGLERQAFALGDVTLLQPHFAAGARVGASSAFGFNRNLPKLGKRTPRHDARTLQFENYVRSQALPAIPPATTWATRIPKNWGMMKNDTIGDCTCAAAGHMIECWTSNAATEVVPTDTEIVDAYAKITGYNPKTGADDNGAVEIDVLNYWRQTGIAGHKIHAFVSLEPGNQNHVQEAVYLFGGCYIGLALPISARDQDVWSVVPGGTTGNGAPGSWGGHAVPIVGYDPRGLIIVTWGELKRMTWGFLDAYCDEAYAILSGDWFNKLRRSPSGFDIVALTRDLRIVTGKSAAVVHQVPKVKVKGRGAAELLGTPMSVASTESADGMVFDQETDTFDCAFPWVRDPKSGQCVR